MLDKEVDKLGNPDVVLVWTTRGVAVGQGNVRKHHYLLLQSIQDRHRLMNRKDNALMEDDHTFHIKNQ